MIQTWRSFAFAGLLVAAGVWCGVLAERKHLLPLPMFGSRTPGWSIGLYEGPSPFVLGPPPGVANPILSRGDVTDVEATTVADPFVVRTANGFFMFFEVVERASGRGSIGLAASPDGLEWAYRGVVLSEPFHLSFPYVFEWNGDHYMVPESHEDLSVRLYRATGFPAEWEYQGDLIRGYHFVDPAIVREDERWWLFVGTRENDGLNLYFADSLQGPWTAHPGNPIVKGDRNRARMGGRIVAVGDTLFRYAQDDDPGYGNAVSAFRIVEMTATRYREEPVSPQPVVQATGQGWTSLGMHHVEPFLQRNGRWWAAVDGLR